MNTLAIVQIPAMDLESVMTQVIRDNPHWDEERVEAAAKEYQRFLTMCKVAPQQRLTPPHDVDQMWHAHILDTKKYTEDCENFFGYFLHHIPWFGDFYDHVAQAETNLFYEKIFGERPPAEWFANDTCHTD